MGCNREAHRRVGGGGRVVRDHDGGVEVGAVVELHAVTQSDRPHREVGAGLRRNRQHRQCPLSVGGHHEQRVVERIGYTEA